MTLSPHPTLFRFCSLSCTLAAAGTLIAIVLAMANPNTAAGLSSATRLLYWGLHVGTAIAAMYIASQLLRSFAPNRHCGTALVLLTGLAGTALVTPVYVALERLWPSAATAAADDWLDLLEQSSYFGTVLAEFVEALTWTMPFWLLINLPLMMSWLIESGKNETDPIAPAPPGENRPTNPPSDSPAPTPPAPIAVASPLQAVPRVYGSDIIAISSDMHYLLITTTRGNTSVLGNLKDAVDELGSRGMQVHRSHWIAHEHVERVISGDGRVTCVMSNGLRIPVSRRRGKSVREQYGVGVVKRD